MSALGPWPRALFLAASLSTVTSVAAGQRVHTVAAGESAASLANKYYGERDLGDLLLRYNGKPGRVIRPGERLTIPFCEVYRARPGDTWSVLAKSRLGRASTSPVLAELNGYAPGEPLRVGARIVFPVVLRHTLARGESLSTLATRFYGDARKAATLQAYGRIDDATRLAVGATLEVPLVGFLRAEADPGKRVSKEPAAVAVPPPAEPIEERTAPVAPDPSTAIASPTIATPEAPISPLSANARRFEAPLAAAGRSFTEGDYDRARDTLEALREQVIGEGAESDRREWGQLLAFVYVALDRDADACEAYRAGSPAAAPAHFDPDLISPRIRAVLERCAGGHASFGRLDNPGPSPQIPAHDGTQR